MRKFGNKLYVKRIKRKSGGVEFKIVDEHGNFIPSFLVYKLTGGLIGSSNIRLNSELRKKIALRDDHVLELNEILKELKKERDKLLIMLQISDNVKKLRNIKYDIKRIIDKGDYVVINTFNSTVTLKKDYLRRLFNISDQKITKKSLEKAVLREIKEQKNVVREIKKIELYKSGWYDVTLRIVFRDITTLNDTYSDYEVNYDMFNNVYFIYNTYSILAKNEADAIQIAVTLAKNEFKKADSIDVVSVEKRTGADNLYAKYVYKVVRNKIRGYVVVW